MSLAAGVQRPPCLTTELASHSSAGRTGGIPTTSRKRTTPETWLGSSPHLGELERRKGLALPLTIRRGCSSGLPDAPSVTFGMTFGAWKSWVRLRGSPWSALRLRFPQPRRPNVPGVLPSSSIGGYGASGSELPTRGFSVPVAEWPSPVAPRETGKADGDCIGGVAGFCEVQPPARNWRRTASRIDVYG